MFLKENEMSKKDNNSSGRKTFNEDRGLTPTTSGTPMPKVKPAAKPPSTSKKS